MNPEAETTSYRVGFLYLSSFVRYLSKRKFNKDYNKDVRLACFIIIFFEFKGYLELGHELMDAIEFSMAIVKPFYSNRTINNAKSYASKIAFESIVDEYIYALNEDVDIFDLLDFNDFDDDDDNTP